MAYRRLRRGGTGMAWTLPRKILLLALSGVGLTLAAVLIPSAYLLRQSLHDIQAQRIDGVARALADDLAENMDAYNRRFAEIARDKAVADFVSKGDKAAQARLSALFASRRFDFPTLSITDAEGRERYKSQLGQSVPDLSHVGGYRVFLEALGVDDRPVHSGAERSPSGEPVVRFAYALRSYEGDLAGELMGETPVSRLNQASRSLGLGEGGYGLVLDARGRMLLDPSHLASLETPEFGDEKGKSLLAAALSGARGVGVTMLFGQQSVVAFAPVRGLGWTVLAVMPYGEYRRPLYRLRYAVIPIICLALVLSAYAAVRGSRSLTRPLRRLTQMAGAMTKGDFTVTADIESKDEVGELAGSFNRMREELLRSHAALEAVVECGRVMLAVPDWDKAVSLALRSLCLGTDADRAFLLEFATEAKSVNRRLITRGQWAKGRDFPAIPPLPGANPDSMLKTLSGGHVLAGPVDGLSLPEREFFASLGAKSVLALAVFSEGEPWGVLGIEDFGNDRVWREGEIKAIQAAAGIFGGSVARRKALTSLNEERDKLDHISRGGHIGMAVVSVERRMTWCNLVAREFFGDEIESVCSDLAGSGGETGDGGPGLQEISHADTTGATGWYQVALTKLLRPDEQSDQTALVFVPVTERKQAELELREAHRAAEEGNRAKRIFMDTVSHELRTPLTGVLGFSEILSHTTIDVEQREFVDGIRSSGKALLAIIDDILELVRTESGAEGPIRRLFPIAPILESAVATFESAVQAKGLALKLDVAGSVPRKLAGDPVRLRQILLKLLDNAVKFTETGTIVLACQAAPDLRAGENAAVLRFSVTDTGPGIPKDKLAMIFERFTQADGSRSRRYGGIGVGLSIVGKLASSMGGKLEVDSKPGEGSCFIFTATFGLPVASDTDAAGQPSQ